MKTLKNLFLLIILSGLILTSCKTDDDENPDPSTPSGSTLTCKANGADWTASLAVVATNSNNIVTCTGSDSNAHQC